MINMFACGVCGGMESLISFVWPVLGFLGMVTVPFVGTIYHKIKHQCCKKSCKCDCHNG